MPIIIPPGFAHVVHSFSLAGDPERMATTYGVALEGGAGDAPNEVAGALHTIFHSNVWDIIPPVYALETTEVRLGGEAGAPSIVGSFSQRQAGTGTDSPLPQNCALLVHKRSNFAGRRNRGRMFLPVGFEGAVDPVGRINGPSIDGVQQRLNQWLTALQGSPLVTQMVILHSPSNAGGGVLSPTPVSTLVIDPVISTQRRRLR